MLDPDIELTKLPLYLKLISEIFVINNQTGASSSLKCTHLTLTYHKKCY